MILVGRKNLYGNDDEKKIFISAKGTKQHCWNMLIFLIQQWAHISVVTQETVNRLIPAKLSGSYKRRVIALALRWSIPTCCPHEFLNSIQVSYMGLPYLRWRKMRISWRQLMRLQTWCARTIEGQAEHEGSLPSTIGYRETKYREVIL